MSSVSLGQARGREAENIDLLESVIRPFDIPRTSRIYVNRSLRLDRIHLVGFDMDYTLALYNQPKMEEISILATIDKLVAAKGYPEAIRNIKPDPDLAIRGLVVDRESGNIFKVDRYGYPGRVLHGRTILPRDKVAELYQRQRVRLGDRRYAWIDTLFALPEASLYTSLVDYIESELRPQGWQPPGYDRLWSDIRECIDLAHRDGSIKDIVVKDLPAYIERDPNLAITLHMLRSSGKRLFLLTNSDWNYTDPVMRFLLDGQLPAYPSWRNYFDVVVVTAAKPEFFTKEMPFVELDGEGRPVERPAPGPFLRNRVYAGGNLKEFEDRARCGGDRILFVGDHIYGDMLRSKKSSAWRTAMIIQELEHEITTYGRLAPSVAHLDKLDAELRTLESQIHEHQMAQRALQKREGRDGLVEMSAAQASAARRSLREATESLKRQLKTLVIEYRSLEEEIYRSFNPYWGALFRQGYEISKFGEQVEAYACVYTSRVSNFRFYSPMHFFRGPRDRMPHEK